jgi:hypothetical protein
LLLGAPTGVDPLPGNFFAAYVRFAPIASIIYVAAQTAAWCQLRTSTAMQQKQDLFDHLVGDG